MDTPPGPINPLESHIQYWKRKTPGEAGMNQKGAVEMIAALFVREDSAYKRRQQIDCYDITRDGLTFGGGCPVVCHPPCRSWGVLAHMAHPRSGEKELALFALEQVRKNGGILEHPAGSKLWKVAGLPKPGEFPDEFGGYTLLIDQYDFGHVARKRTHLYICGLDQRHLPPLPPKRATKPKKSMTGQVPGTRRCTQYEREYTPERLIDWFCVALTPLEVFA